MSNNRVFINEHDIVETVVVGDQTVESVQAMGIEAYRLIDTLIAQGKRPLYLDNIFEVGKSPAEARKLVIELVKSSRLEKVAFVGGGGTLKLLSNLMLQAIGQSKKAKHFDDYDEAIEWLKHR